MRCKLILLVIATICTTTWAHGSHRHTPCRVVDANGVIQEENNCTTNMECTFGPVNANFNEVDVSLYFCRWHYVFGAPEPPTDRLPSMAARLATRSSCLVLQNGIEMKNVACSGQNQTCDFGPLILTPDALTTLAVTFCKDESGTVGLLDAMTSYRNTYNGFFGYSRYGSNGWGGGRRQRPSHGRRHRFAGRK